MKLRVGTAAVALALGVLNLVGGSASAGPLAGGPPVFTLDASSSVGGDVLHLTPRLTTAGGGIYAAHGSETVPSFSIVFDFTLNPDPAVSGSFTLTNLSATPQTFSVSATLSVLPIAGPTKMGGSFGDATYTDVNQSSDVEISSAAFYRALIDGVGVKDLGKFDSSASGGPGVFGTISQESFGTPIPSAAGPGVSSSIGVGFPGFTLTSGDSVQVPFEFVVTAPEPAFAPLFAIGTAVILCVFARKNASTRSKRSGRILPTGG